MTTEQTIVLGVLAAAFVAGWAIRALIDRADRRDESDERSTPADQGVDPGLEQSRRELEQTLADFMTRLASSGGARSQAGRPGALVDEVSAALADDVANEAMIAGVNGSGLSERELDLTDWGFAYGVAWARVRDRRPADPADEVAGDARRAAESVFREYAAEAPWAPATGAPAEGEATAPAEDEATAPAEDEATAPAEGEAPAPPESGN